MGIGTVIQLKEPKTVIGEDGETFNMTERVATEWVERINEALIDEMYRKYKDSGISKLYLLDETEFGAFLKKMLPMWCDSKKDGE